MDESIWGYAKDNGFVIVSKDSEPARILSLEAH